MDTAFAVQMVQSADILIADVKKLLPVIARRAKEHQMTPCIGRSHGIHGEPTTFGLKLALMHDEFGRALERLERARKVVAVGKLSGAVGTNAHLSPDIEAFVCKKLGLQPAPIATQVVQRDIHAEFMTTLALVGASIERWAVEFRHLQRTEVLEAEEPFTKGQKGSSAMPHKRNPITWERLTGLARVLRGNAVAALENVALWHERDISALSRVERIIFPDSCTLLDYMFGLLTRLMDGLAVYPENMKTQPRPVPRHVEFADRPAGAHQKRPDARGRLRTGPGRRDEDLGGQARRPRRRRFPRSSSKPTPRSPNISRQANWKNSARSTSISRK